MGWRRPWRARVTVTVIGAALTLASVPTAAAADDPAEPFTLPGDTPSAIAADVDGDGSRELVRLTGSEPPIRLEVWTVMDGRWATTLSTEVEAGGNSPTALIRVMIAGIDRVLLLVGGPVTASGQSGCCLTVHELVGREGRLALTRVDAPDVAADSVVVADLDGDGTDELVASLTTWSGDEPQTSTDVAVLARDAAGWTALVEWEEAGAWWVNAKVESDGAPGSELIASDENGDVARLAWMDGRVVIERTELTLGNEQAWVVGSVDGNLIAAASTAVAIVRWPQDGEPSVLVSRETVDYPGVGILGSGADALLVIQEHSGSGATSPVSQILDVRLRPVGEVAMSATVATLAELSDRLGRQGWSGSPPTNIWPYVGPEDGVWGEGSESFIIGGTRITHASGGTFESRPVGALVGWPIGRVGPEDGWVALSDFYAGTGAISYLQVGSPFEGSRLTLVPSATFEDPAARELATLIALERGVVMSEDGDVTELLVAPTGAEIVVSVPPGTQAVSWDGRTVTDHGAITESGLRLPVELPPRPRPGRASTFELDLVLVGPDGTATVHRWEGTFALEAPELTAWTDVDALSLEATVAGRASPLSVVTVDGEPVELNEFGAYRATVSAPPWPRNVVVVARDPFGGEQRTTVEVIGLLDYRGWPWGAVAAVLTVLVGGVFFLRTPRHRPVPQRTALDDGRLEDLDGDLI